MNIVIASAKGVDLGDIIERSPVSARPGALEALKDYIRRSTLSWAGFIDGKPACVWGLMSGSFLSNEAYLWLLTTDLSDAHPLVFVRHSQNMVREMLKVFPVIRGHVVIGSDKSIRWLKWLGVEFEAANNGLIRFQLRSGVISG